MPTASIGVLDQIDRLTDLDQIDRLTDTAAGMLADEKIELKFGTLQPGARWSGEAGTQHFFGFCRRAKDGQGRQAGLSCALCCAALSQE
jgi:hypothetical protein